jgi:DNA replication and repair protein RecF
LRVDGLALEDFRNYEREHVDLSPGLNLVVGRNAQGKTNLLEAIYCLAGLGSPRAADAALVRISAERALLHARLTRGSRSIRVDLELRPGRGTRALVNRTPVPGLHALGEVTSAVFFGPDELSLIKGSPDGRRRFLDDLSVKLRPSRHGLRREWERVLRQRNALLKTMPRSAASSASARTTLEVWDEALCRIGASVAAARLEALARLLPHARKRYADVAGGGDLELVYDSEWIAASSSVNEPGAETVSDEGLLRTALATALESVRSKELERGLSLAGPQRDDVTVLLGARAADGFMDARAFASQGDQRTAALALKLAESDLLAESLSEAPIVLLDDVFSELDPTRRAWLADAVRGLGQVVLSSAEPDAAAIAGADRVLEVDRGHIRDGSKVERHRG